jgi:hypothetical protein
MNVKHKLPCQILSFSKMYEDDDDLMKVRIKVCHDGDNPNGSNVSLDSLSKAEETLKNRPILAYSVFDEDKFEVVDFGGHDMQHKLVENDEGEYEVKTRYLETPLGVINEDHEYSLEYDEDTEKTYPVITGYIWKSYSNGAWKLIEEGKGVSMEISVKSGTYNKERKIFEITDFSYRGITVLSDSVTPAMEGANIDKYTLNELDNSVEEFNQKLKEKEELIMEKTTKTIVEETDNITMKVENKDYASKVSIDEDGIGVSVDNKEPETKEFALSVDNIRLSINNQLKERTVEAEDWWGDKYQKREFYLFDIIPDEKVAICEDNLNYYNYYGIPYEIQGDEAVLNFDGKVAYIQEWRPKQEGEVVLEFNKEDELKDIVLKKFSNKEKEIETIKTDLEKLEEFKSKVDLEEFKVKVNEVAEKFDIKVDISDLKEKAISKEITLEQFEEKIGYLFALEIMDKKTYSHEKEEKATKVIVNDDKPAIKPYGGLLG